MFSAKSKTILPIKGLPKVGQNYLFAGAIKSSVLHHQIEEYVKLAKKKGEWYNNVNDEECAMPSTFAVFALGLESDKYFDLVIDYLQTVDEEHQSIQEKFAPVFLEKYTINKQTIKVYINCILSMQGHPHHKIFKSYFNNETSLNLLLDNKTHFAEYYFTTEYIEDFKDNKNEMKEMADYCWESVMYTTFGKSENYDKIAKQFPIKEREIFEKLRTK